MKSVYEHLLSEDVCLKKFGNSLFGDVFGGERDTEYEKKLVDRMKIFFGQSGQFSDRDKLVDAFKVLKKCTNHFPKELSSSTGIIYRGVRRTSKDLISIQDWKYTDSTKEIMAGTVKYESRYPIQSWTTNSVVAWGFASNKIVSTKFQKGEKFVGGHIPTVFMGVVDKKDLLFSSDFIHRFKQKTGLEIRNEYEVVRVSNQPFTCKILVRMEDLVTPLGKFTKINQELGAHLATLGINSNIKNRFVRPLK